MNFKNLLLFLAIICLSSCTAQNNKSTTSTKSPQQKTTNKNLDGYSKAYFAAGCFWCVEAVFESVEGVHEAVSGYAGGTSKNPTYEIIGTGKTRHAEAVEVYYDADVVSFATLLKVFFGSQDPTTPNRQGPDAGPQYRSIAFYQNADEKQLIENYIKELEEGKVFNDPIVTEVSPLTTFYIAEDYHQDYEKLNPNNPYVQRISIPRLKRFQAKFPELLK